MPTFDNHTLKTHFAFSTIHNNGRFLNTSSPKSITLHNRCTVGLNFQTDFYFRWTPQFTQGGINYNRMNATHIVEFCKDDGCNNKGRVSDFSISKQFQHYCSWFLGWFSDYKMTVLAIYGSLVISLKSCRPRHKNFSSRAHPFISS